MMVSMEIFIQNQLSTSGFLWLLALCGGRASRDLPFCWSSHSGVLPAFSCPAWSVSLVLLLPLSPASSRPFWWLAFGLLSSAEDGQALHSCWSLVSTDVQPFLSLQSRSHLNLGQDRYQLACCWWKPCYLLPSGPWLLGSGAGCLVCYEGSMFLGPVTGVH